MIETLIQFAEDHAAWIGWMAGASVVLLVISLVTLPLVAVLLPADFLELQMRAPGERPVLPASDWRIRRPILRWSLRILKNLAALLLAVAGLAMLVLPGQGLLTLALAALLLDFPGKRRLIGRLIGSRRILRMLNGIRRRFNRPPLTPPPPRS